MTYTISRIGPEFTPGPIKFLITTTLVLSLLSALFNPLFTQVIKMMGPQDFFSLTRYGLQNFYIWQFVTFLFIQADGYFGIHLFFLISLGFQMYILWVMGSTVHDHVGSSPFLRLYFTSGILAGLLTLILGNVSIVAGSIPAILAVLMVWTMLHPETELLLFFIIPVKAKWIMAGIFGAIILISLSQLEFSNLLFSLTGAIVGYLYAVIAWDLRGPFAFSHSFERSVSYYSSRIRSKEITKQIREKGQIFDISSGSKRLDDDKFMDEMLHKISMKGEQSLTWGEKKRMKEISEKRMKEE